jgi:hypothetical protein
MLPQTYWYVLGSKDKRGAILGPYDTFDEADHGGAKYFGFLQYKGITHRSFIVFCEYTRDAKITTDKATGIIKGFE